MHFIKPISGRQVGSFKSQLLVDWSALLSAYLLWTSRHFEILQCTSFIKSISGGQVGMSALVRVNLWETGPQVNTMFVFEVKLKLTKGRQVFKCKPLVEW